MSLDKDHSILAQVAFKGAVELVAASISRSSYELDEDYATAAVVRLSEDLKAYLYELHDVKSATALRGSSYVDEEEMPARPAVSATQAQAAVEDAFPGTQTQTDGYEFTGDCKLPIPDWFYSEVEKKGKTHIKFWWDNRTPEGNPPTTSNGKVGPAFKSKGKDKANEVAIFKPTPRAR